MIDLFLDTLNLRVEYYGAANGKRLKSPLHNVGANAPLERQIARGFGLLPGYIFMSFAANREGVF